MVQDQDGELRGLGAFGEVFGGAAHLGAVLILDLGGTGEVVHEDEPVPAVFGDRDEHVNLLLPGVTAQLVRVERSSRYAGLRR